MRAFFGFAQRRNWIPNNPATGLKAPKVTLCPTLPFNNDEMRRILVATDKYREEMPSHGIANGKRIRGLVLLLRYSGMRIGDAVNFNIERLEGNRVFLYTQKTGVAVNTVLPDFVVCALAATPKVTDKFFFWSGKGKLDSIVRSWQTRLRRLFKLANIPDGHAHRFRDTFAVELLLAGVPIERVSVLLGHQSMRITEKHYAPWVRSRQEQLEADLARAWGRDPLVLSRGEVHARYTEGDNPVTHPVSTGKNGARGGSRTHMRKNPRRILSPQRLPFRHPGAGFTNLTNEPASCNTLAQRSVSTSNAVVSGPDPTSVLEFEPQRKLHYARLRQQAGVRPKIVRRLGQRCKQRRSHALSVKTRQVRHVEHFPAELK
jgi:site-specific recombinase XerD